MSQDAGLFGPDSVTWRVHTDPTYAVAGLRGLLLQALHPLAMAAVEQNGGFEADPWGRLTRTSQYIATTTFGTEVEALRAAARVRGIHRKLRGTDPLTGAEFRLDRPDLLLWVHCCEVDSLLSTALRGGLALTAAESDAYLAEQVRSAELVGSAGVHGAGESRRTGRLLRCGPSGPAADQGRQSWRQRYRRTAHVGVGETAAAGLGWPGGVVDGTAAGLGEADVPAAGFRV